MTHEKGYKFTDGCLQCEYGWITIVGFPYSVLDRGAVTKERLDGMKYWLCMACGWKRRVGHPPKNKPILTEQQVRELGEYYHKYYNLRIVDLANKVHVSPSTIQLAFKRCNIPIKQGRVKEARIGKLTRVFDKETLEDFRYLYWQLDYSLPDIAEYYNRLRGWDLTPAILNYVFKREHIPQRSRSQVNKALARRRRRLKLARVPNPDVQARASN